MKTELKYGVIFAIVVVVYVMIEHFLGLNTTRHDIGQYTRFGGVLIPIIGIFVGIRAKRDRELNGSITFGQGVKTGFLIAVVQTTITTLWFWFYGAVLNPQFTDTMLEFERSKMLLAGRDEIAVRATIDRLKTIYSFPYLQLAQEVAGILYGTVFAIIFSAFLKKKRQEAS